MELPVRAFWMMNRNINRLRAEEDLRQINIGTAIQSRDGASEASSRLVVERGEWLKFSPLATHLNCRDEEGVERLKRMAKGA